MSNLAAEMHAAAEKVRQPHIDRLKGLGVTGDAMVSVWGAFAPFGVAMIEPLANGTFLPAETGPLYVVQPVTYEGELIDLVAWRPLTPGKWLTRMGTAWAMGEDRLSEYRWDVARLAPPNLWGTPLDWLRASGDGFCVLDWEAQDVRGLQGLDAVRCADRGLSKLLIDTISRPVRVPRILPMEVRRAA